MEGGGDRTGENRVSFAPGVDRAAAAQAASQIMRRDGAVVLDDVIDPALIARCRDQLIARYPDFATPDRERNFGGHVGRHTHPLVVEDALADPAVLLPDPVAAIADSRLGRKFKVDSFGALVALPGAPDQNAHRDAWLFEGERIDHILPAYAIAVAIPLVTMDEISGRTAFWRGTHRSANVRPTGEHDFAPVVHPGSVLLWDFRVYHHGLANRGAAPRPVLFSVVAREWWIEGEQAAAKHYAKLRFTRPAFAALDPAVQARFSRATLIDPAPSR
jgi:ectoine hydroxylase-related dioxygenase (phytanoyl-CoA dioxygenase family)